jgi:hypothetical protein
MKIPPDAPLDQLNMPDPGGKHKHLSKDTIQPKVILPHAKVKSTLRCVIRQRAFPPFGLDQKDFIRSEDCDGAPAKGPDERSGGRAPA